MKRILAALIIAILVLPLMATPVLAASLGISPSKIDVEIPENGTVQVDFEVHYFTGYINAKVVGMPFEVYPTSFDVASSPTTITLTFTDTNPDIQSNENYEGYVRFEGAVGTTVSLVVNVKARVTIQMTAIVASPPAPSNGGGNGGGNGGDVPPTMPPTLPVPPTIPLPLPVPPTIPVITVAPISVPSTDGKVSVNVHTGTAMKDSLGNPISTVTVAPLTTIPIPPEDTEVIGMAYDFGPDGATFEPPITLTFKYTEGDIPEGVNEADLTVAYYDEASGEWIELVCVVDTATNTITAQVAHFTTFTVMVKNPVTEVVPPAVVEPTTKPDVTVVEPEKPTITPDVIIKPATPVVVPHDDTDLTKSTNWAVIGSLTGVAVASLIAFVIIIRRRKKVA